MAGSTRRRLLGRPRHARVRHPVPATRTVPAVRSLLMDRATLLAHHEPYVIEPSPTDADCRFPTPEEEALYRDLIEGRYGPAVRLEQERVRFSSVRSALEPWLGPECTAPA